MNTLHPPAWVSRLLALLAAAAGLLCMAGGGGAAQPTGSSPLSPPPNSPARGDSTWHALINATVHIRPGETLENATIIFRDGVILAVEPPLPGRDGRSAPLPPSGAGARIWDATGLHIYPGFIDAHVEVTAPAPDVNAPGVHWNTRVMPQRSALDGRGIDRRTAESLRRLGFTAAGIAPQDGIFRGTGAVVSLAAPASEASADRPPVYRERTYHAIAFDTARRARSESPDVQRWSTYPNSLMGAIALIRQTLIDADWQTEARRSGAAIAANALDHLAAPAPSATAAAPATRRRQGPTDERLNDELLLAALAHENARSGSAAPPPPSPEQRRGSDRSPARTQAPANTALEVDRGLPLLFDTSDELDALRAARIAREFDRPAIILGSGYEFRRLTAIADEGFPIILPLRFARMPDVTSVGRAEAVELRDLMTWEQSPTNPRRLDAAGLKVALTTGKLRNRNEFQQNLTSAIQHGLSPDRALAMLTTHPAELLGVADRLGTIEVGKVANLVVADGPLFVGFTDAAPPSDDHAAESDSAEQNPPSGKEDQAESGDEPRDETNASAVARGRIRDVWIDGFRHSISPAPEHDHVGAWHIFESDGKRIDPADPGAVTITITRENRVTVRRNDITARATNVRVESNRLDWTLDGTILDIDAALLDTAAVENDILHGTTRMPDGQLIRWKARRVETPDPQPPRPEPDPQPEAPDTFAGVWHIAMDDQPDEEVRLEISPEHAVSIFIGGQQMPAQDVAIDGDAISFRFDGVFLGIEGFADVTATRDGNTLRGRADLGDTDVQFTGSRDPNQAQPEQATARPRRGVVGRAPAPSRRDPGQQLRDAIAEIPEHYGYPFGPYMLEDLPPQDDTLFINATLWTAGEAGIVENGWMFISEGRISAMGEGTPPSRLTEGNVIDLEGRHVSPGIIDCHSHTGISRGVNESGRAVTAEVRIGDVTNPDAISWYRQLASGVTTVNSLHGSANPIGGQSQTNKVRWGVRHPGEMHMEGAKPGIKFALGENVKQSNWGDRNTVRYPQTRMGVETLIRDRFKAARQYAARMAEGASEGSLATAGPRALPPRRDLELEALAEILAGERLVHCHSYRQDEILMLCRIADEFDFTIGTFQHILEGYKVADEVARHAIGASAFSDWWAFKVEVQDAIPHAGPIMWEQGVVVSYNSDSDELARRMHGEAAKAIKYSSPDHAIEPNEALKFITLNAAIQLGIDDRVGSLEVGKDADFAIWSGPPLSSLSRVEATYIDGRRYFSLDDDQRHREFIQRERERLIQKALAEHRRRPAGRQREQTEDPPAFAGDDSPRRQMLRAMYLDMINRGLDPSAARPGDCGCDEAEFHLHW